MTCDIAKIIVNRVPPALLCPLDFPPHPWLNHAIKAALTRGL